MYIVPGRVTDRLSDGCNRLVKQGAGIVLSPESFLEEIWQLWETGKKEPYSEPERQDDTQAANVFLEQQKTAGLSGELAEIYKVLDFAPKSPEEICQQLSGRYSEKQIITCLMQLCMESLAVQVSPGRFCCRRS